MILPVPENVPAITVKVPARVKSAESVMLPPLPEEPKVRLLPAVVDVISLLTSTLKVDVLPMTDTLVLERASAITDGSILASPVMLKVPVLWSKLQFVEVKVPAEEIVNV